MYNFSVHDEMRRHSGRGIGGGVALLLTFIAGVAMPFVTPAEVGSLYTRRGQAAPVSGWTGLWYLGPMAVGYLAQFFIIFAAFALVSGGGTGTGVALGTLFFFWIALVIAGGVTWFVKTNSALNAYWASVGVVG